MNDWDSLRVPLEEACENPRDEDAIADGIRVALTQREQLRARGLEHARSFTWVENGRAHLRAWESVQMKTAP